jgi:4-alpha-glucanotransferase
MLAIAPVQDLLELGAEARMNRPGYSDGNWRWRATKQMLNVSVFEGLRKLTEKSGRSPLSHKSAIANAFGVTS